MIKKHQLLWMGSASAERTVWITNHNDGNDD